MENKNLELIEILLSYGFAITAQDDEYYRFKYYTRDEDISDTGIFIVEENIKIELDFSEKKFRISGTLTNDKDTYYNGDRSFNFIPTIEELVRLLKDQYGLEPKERWNQ